MPRKPGQDEFGVEEGRQTASDNDTPGLQPRTRKLEMVNYHYFPGSAHSVHPAKLLGETI